MVSIINKNYKMSFKLISKLATKILTINVLDSKLVSKRLIDINLEYKVVGN